jgi:hypothetical protein
MRAPQHQSPEFPADGGLLCAKAATLGDKIKDTRCTYRAPIVSA